MSIPEKTIFASATAPGRSGVAVVRVSGIKTKAIVEGLTDKPLPQPRMATLRVLKERGSGQMIDRALVLWFPGSASFTGEDCAEFHVHGGRAILSALYQALQAFEGVSIAEPGEFTRRAVENGKMDLTAAEGLIDLINAETESQRKLAFRQMEGELGALYESWRAKLINAQALIEAEIDFSDEGDVESGVSSRARQTLLTLNADLSSHLDDARRGERLRDGVRAVIFGPPNAGKSTLFNHLAQRNVAIVSDIPGTTRDILEVYLDIAGYPLIIADTAGIHNTDHIIEGEGVKRAEQRVADSDISLVVLDGSAPYQPHIVSGLLEKADIVILNKSDLGVHPSFTEGHGFVKEFFTISASSGAGVDRVIECLSQLIYGMFNVGDDIVLTRERHRVYLEQARQGLSEAITAMDCGRELALVAESIRHAVQQIGAITGRVDVEDMLDVVFRDFCIGK